MGLDNSLNVSELLRRLGVKGDSLGSAPLLESLRLTLNIGDLGDLVPPLGVPYGGSALSSTSAVATFNKWSLECRSAGGLRVAILRPTGTGNFRIFVTATNPFGATVLSGQNDYSFAQPVVSVFSTHTPDVQVAPTDSFQISEAQPGIGLEFDNWIGPGEFFNIEDRAANNGQTMVIAWKEYPAALNP